MNIKKSLAFASLVFTGATACPEENLTVVDYCAAVTNHWGVSLSDCFRQLSNARRVPFMPYPAEDVVHRVFFDILALDVPETATNDYERARWINAKESAVSHLSFVPAIYGDTNCQMQAAREHGRIRSMKPEWPWPWHRGITNVVEVRFSNEAEKKAYFDQFYKARTLEPAYTQLEDALVDPLQNCFCDPRMNGYPGALGMTIPELNAFVSNLVTAARLTPEEAARYGLTNRFEAIGGR